MILWLVSFGIADHWPDGFLEGNGMDPNLRYNARTKAIIEWVLAHHIPAGAR